MKKFLAKLEKKERLNKETFLFHFGLIGPREINFSAGQYIILEVPIKENQSARRLYSIASPSNWKNSIELIVKIVPGGLGSTYLSNLKIGEKVKFSGPAGLFTFKENEKPKIFLATGTGIAPIRSMLLTHFHGRKEKSILMWGLRKKEDIYLEKELKKISKENTFQYYICLSREEASLKEPYLKGRIQNNLEKIKPYVKTADFYICGGRDAVEDLKNKLLDLGTPRENLHFEKF